MMSNLQIFPVPIRANDPFSLTSSEPETLYIFHSFHWIYSNPLPNFSFKMHFLYLDSWHTDYFLNLHPWESMVTQRSLRTLSVQVDATCTPSYRKRPLIQGHLCGWRQSCDALWIIEFLIYVWKLNLWHKTKILKPEPDDAIHFGGKQNSLSKLLTISYLRLTLQQIFYSELRVLAIDDYVTFLLGLKGQIEWKYQKTLELFTITFLIHEFTLDVVCKFQNRFI